MENRPCGQHCYQISATLMGRSTCGAGQFLILHCSEMCFSLVVLAFVCSFRETPELGRSRMVTRKSASPVGPRTIGLRGQYCCLHASVYGVKVDPDPEVDSRVVLQSRVSAALPWCFFLSLQTMSDVPFEAEQRICSSRIRGFRSEMSERFFCLFEFRRMYHSTRLLNAFPADSVRCLFTV